MNKYLKSLVLLFIPLLTLSAQASTNASSGVMVKSRNSNPNVIFLSIDDVGRERYPSLDSPLGMSGSSQTFDDGTSYQSQSNTPGLSRLLANGINFEGAWSGPACAPSRAMLRCGDRTGGCSSASEVIRQIQNGTDEVYRVLSGGKTQLGGAGASINGAGAVTDATCRDDGSGPLSNWNVGEASLGYSTSWSQDYTYTKCEVGQTTPTALTWQPGNSSNDDYIYMDEAMTDVALEFITEDAFSGGNPKSLWENHYAKPFIIHIGYHTYHGDNYQDLSHFINGRVQIDSQIKTGSAYQTKAAIGVPIQGANDTWPQAGYHWYELCPGYPNGDDNNASTAKNLFMVDRACANTAISFVDTQIERFLDTLGEAGLRNTLFIFTGDNGSNSANLGNRNGLNKGADDFFSSTATGDSLVGACDGTYCGKSTVSETGLNVPFVMAGGVIDRDNYGTSSKLRLLNTDVAETIIQTIIPSGASYTPEGRDFTDIYTADCGSGACDTLAGFEITISQGESHHTAGEEVSAVQELTNGSIFRVQRVCGVNDWVQDLASATPNADLRSQVGGGNTDLNTAYADLDAALIADGNPAEGTACTP